MARPVSVTVWNDAVRQAGGDPVPWVQGSRNRRLLPGDNPAFRALRRLLRERGEWHGTVVQLQKELADDHYCTAFGRLLNQAIPFLVSECSWEKHTLAKWGVVHFFHRRAEQRCRTHGCWGRALARGRCWD